MKRDFNAWLASLGPAAPVKTLTQLREWNLAHRAEGAIKYGQAQLDNSDAVDLERDRARYQADREKDMRVSRSRGDRRRDEARPARRADFSRVGRRGCGGQAGLSDGDRAVWLRAERAAPPFPAGFDAKPAPLGISFTGTACSEPRLIELAYAFEQATKRRVPPPEFP